MSQVFTTQIHLNSAFSSTGTKCTAVYTFSTHAWTHLYIFYINYCRLIKIRHMICRDNYSDNNNLKYTS